MSILSRAADLGYAFRFLKLLTTPWNKLKAYELGIVDENGKNLKRAKELKTKVNNKKINHVHIKNKSAILQNTEIKINNFGQRDIQYDNSKLSEYDRSFLIIGSSVAMGWGVEHEKVFSNRLNKKSFQNKKKWIFINGGVGNYNTQRYVNNYFENWKELDFTDIIIHFFAHVCCTYSYICSSMFMSHLCNCYTMVGFKSPERS